MTTAISTQSVDSTPPPAAAQSLAGDVYQAPVVVIPKAITVDVPITSTVRPVSCGGQTAYRVQPEIDLPANGRLGDISPLAQGSGFVSYHLCSMVVRNGRFSARLTPLASLPDLVDPFDDEPPGLRFWVAEARHAGDPLKAGSIRVTSLRLMPVHDLLPGSSDPAAGDQGVARGRAACLREIAHLSGPAHDIASLVERSRQDPLAGHPSSSVDLSCPFITHHP